MRNAVAGTVPVAEGWGRGAGRIRTLIIAAVG